jgi:hypothetical protein
MPRTSSSAATSEETVQAAWRVIEAAHTRCIAQVDSPGVQALLRWVRDEALVNGLPRAWRLDHPNSSRSF